MQVQLQFLEVLRGLYGDSADERLLGDIVCSFPVLTGDTTSAPDGRAGSGHQPRRSSVLRSVSF